MADETKTKAERFTPDEVIAKQRNKHLMILVGVIVVLAALVAITRATKTETEPLKKVMLAGVNKDAAAAAKDEVKTVEIWKGNAKDHLKLNRDGDTWRVPSRFNAPADKKDVDTLLTRVFNSSRVNRASINDKSKFVLYGLDDESGVHLRLVDDKGKQMLHLLLGHTDGSTRDFVRLLGEGQPQGIYELTGPGGEYDTLYSALNLGSNGEPNAKNWVSTGNFEILPVDGVVQTFTLRDGDSSVSFQRKPGSDPADDDWQMTSPRKGKADGTAVHAVLDALRTYSASDIAGRDTDAAKFGVASPDKEVTLTYAMNNKPVTAHLYFGNKNDANEVAIWLKTDRKGEFIYWGSDFVLSRVFRKPADLMKKERVGLVPDGVDAEDLTINDGTDVVKLMRKGKGATTQWTMQQPLEHAADSAKVAAFIAALKGLQGYKPGADLDRNALQLGPGLSQRWITAAYVPKKADDKDSDKDDAPDKPDADKPADDKPAADKPADEKPEEKPEEKPAETGPALKTATLYFGKTVQGEVPTLRVIDGKEQLFWLSDADVAKLFKQPGAYAKLEALELAPIGSRVEDMLITNGQAILQLTLEGKAGANNVWHIKQPWDEPADQSDALSTLQAVKTLKGVRLDAPLDNEKYGLGEGVSKRELDVKTSGKDGDQLQTLYFGERLHGLVTGLLKRAEGKLEYYLFMPGDLFQLFVSPKDQRVLPQFSGKVRHILITWKDNGGGAAPKDPERTEAQARKLADEIAQRARNGEDFVKLQKEYNDDSGDPTHVYDVDPTAHLVKPFLRLSSELKPGEVGVVESAYGIHVIKRIE